MCSESQAAHERSRAPCWVLLGPTASGKTEVSVRLARRHPLEIVSVDSMQVYRGMDIGTAKPDRALREEIPHHMVDVVEPEEYFNVARFRAMAVEAMQGIRRRGRRPLLICGTPLYLKALLWGLFDGPGADAQIRSRLGGEAARDGVASLHRRLSQVDPRAAERIDSHDLKRIIRALEVYELTGEPISARQGEFDEAPRLGYIGVGLRPPRRLLHERISRRATQMLAEGLLEEVRQLRPRLGPQARQAVGYKELVEHLDGRSSLAEAVDRIKTNTRQFAKQQLAWFRRFPGVQSVRPTEGKDPEQLAVDCERAFLGLEHSNALSYD